MNWWYYFKKSFSLYPGLGAAISAPFLHQYYHCRREERSWLRALLDGLICLLFQLWVPLRARWVARKFGFDEEWARLASGIGRRRIADPNDIAVFRIAADRDLDRYMRRFEYAEISKRANPAAWSRDCVLADKMLFAKRCEEFLLPSPRFLAHLCSHRIEVANQPEGPLLAVKPTSGISGTDFMIVPYPEWRQGREAFEAFLRSWLGAHRGNWIAQSKVEAHPGLKDLALDALSTARITTMLNENGDPEIVTSVLRFAGKREAVVDNLAAGGLLAPIDLETGMLGPACYGRKPGDVTAHPVTGAPVEGRVLPDWPDTRDLVLRAHRDAFSEYSMIGWDVGIGVNGPVLIEGNGKPGLFAAQRAERQGVGETRFGELIAFHLDRAAERRHGGPAAPVATDKVERPPTGVLRATCSAAGAGGLHRQTTAQLLVSGGDDRLALDAGGFNAYGCRPIPAIMTSYSSSTANSISAAAFNAVRALHFVLGERIRKGEAAPQVYAESLERLRTRLRGIYDLGAGDAIDIAMAPSGTDLELLVLALALATRQPVLNILVGEDEVGSGCVLSAAGRHFRSETALVGGVPKGERIHGFDDVGIDLVKIEVRRSNGQSRPRADILDDIRVALDSALASGRRPVVHVVHRSKTGIVVPGMSEVEQLAEQYGPRIDIAVDACQGRISPANLRHYLAMGAAVMVTGSKFIGGPPFSGFAFIPEALSQRLRSAGAPFPAGLSDYFLRSEMPSSWAAADAALDHVGANFGLLLRLEAAVFELQRLSVLPADAILRVVDAFGRSIRSFVARSKRFDLFIAAEGLRPESHIEHPFERDMLFTLRVNADPPVMIDEARALYHALYEDRSGSFADAADIVVASEEIHTGQPVRCLQDEYGGILGTLRLSLSASLISDMAGLDENALLARFAADFDRIENKVDLLLEDQQRGAL